jgi:uncharacterized protein with FMN-binding domain
LWQGSVEFERGCIGAPSRVELAALDILDFDKSQDVGKKLWDENYGPTIDRIIKSQSPNVDVISGATATTKTLLRAVENALVEAGGKP